MSFYSILNYIYIYFVRSLSTSPPLLPDGKITAPKSRAQRKEENKQKRFFERVVQLAANADKAAQLTVQSKRTGEGKQLLPDKPSIKKHRRRDVDFYFNHGEEGRLEKLRKEGKVAL